MTKQRSRYKFVTQHDMFGRIYWKGYVRFDKRAMYTKCFPLTDEGEKQAYEAAILLRESLRKHKHAEALRSHLPEPLYQAVIAQLNGSATVQLADGELARMITDTVCKHYGTTMPNVFSPSRQRTITNARFVAMVLIREHTDLSVIQIGKMFNRDHTAVIHACKTIGDRLQVESDLRNDFESINIKITQKRYR